MSFPARSTASPPRHIRPRVRSTDLPVPERRIGPARLIGLGLNAGVALPRDVGARVGDRPALPPRAGHEDDARLVARAEERVPGAAGAVDEVPGTQRPLLLFDQ